MLPSACESWFCACLTNTVLSDGSSGTSGVLEKSVQVKRRPAGVNDRGGGAGWFKSTRSASVGCLEQCQTHRGSSCEALLCYAWPSLWCEEMLAPIFLARARYLCLLKYASAHDNVRAGASFGVRTSRFQSDHERMTFHSCAEKHQYMAPWSHVSSHFLRLFHKFTVYRSA